MPDKHQPGIYEIRVQGHIPEHRASWFEEMTIFVEGEGQTVLRGEFADQAALHGVLNKLRDLNIPLLSVNSV